MARAQDVFGTLGTGVEAKAHAGFGLLSSRNAAANYYNPANLTLSNVGLSPSVVLDIAQIKYSYEYPGYDPVVIDRTAPIPFFGLSYRPQGLKTLAIGASLLAFPSSSASSKIEKLPTRQFGEDPVLIDAEQKGTGLSIRGAFGLAYKIVDGLSFGLSLQYTAGGGELIATNHDNGDVLLKDSGQSKTQTVLLGGRGTTLKGRLLAAFSLVPYSQIKQTGHSEIPILDNASIDRDDVASGPLRYGLAVGYRVYKGLTPWLEYHMAKYSALRGREQQSSVRKVNIDYFDAAAYAFGVDYLFSRSQLYCGYGIYQSPLGQGIMEDFAPDAKELVGMEFQNLDMMPRDVFSIGYTSRGPVANLGAALSYLSGQREVWDKARGYGKYNLNIISLTGSWTHFL